VKVLIVEPYLTGSHAAWAEEYAARSRHEVGILGLPGRYWKWRMHGGAITLARRFLKGDCKPDLILATDMLDLTTFLALTRERTTGIKTAVYFHENQICYPWSESDRDRSRGGDLHYGFINLASALAADSLVFNSEYHRRAFREALGPFLKGFPDYNEMDVIEDIGAKSRVLYLGLDLARFDRFRQRRAADAPTLLLWNHRWEYDKNPEGFFQVLYQLEEEGLHFEVVLLGEAFAEKPTVFEEASARLGDRIVHAGYVEDFATYAAWLWKADIIPVTSLQDSFGASVVQAIYCDCCPVLPRRLAYPEHLPQGGEEFFYGDRAGMASLLRRRIEHIKETREISGRETVGRYDWSVMAPQYDEFFEALTAGKQP
jgi:glycosyltransferase involved in cell wall biosynthesis